MVQSSSHGEPTRQTKIVAHCVTTAYRGKKVMKARRDIEVTVSLLRGHH
jgi:hypothetical protein